MGQAGQMLRYEIRRKGHSQREAAGLLKTSEGNLANIISGRAHFPEWLCVSLEEIGINDRYYWSHLCRREELQKINQRYDEIEAKWKRNHARSGVSTQPVQSSPSVSDAVR